MIKNIVASALAAMAFAVPGQARVESGTKPLIELIDSAGITILYNSADCESDEYLGLYRHSGMKRAFILCPGETVDAVDHMVVRHEAIHVIQHCVNVARGTDVLEPVLQDDDVLMAWVREYLTEEQIEEIKQVYDPSHWRIEFEAFAGMHAYSADELAELVQQACLYDA